MLLALMKSDRAKMFIAFMTIAGFTILIAILSSFVPVAHLFTSAGSSEKMKKFDNSTDIRNKLYDNFQGGIYPLTDGQELTKW